MTQVFLCAVHTYPNLNKCGFSNMYAVSENPGEYHACLSSYSLFAFPFPEFISATLTLIFYKECFLLIKLIWEYDVPKVTKSALKSVLASSSWM